MVFTNFERKFLNIEILGANGSHKALIEIFQKIGMNLQSCLIKDSTLDDFTMREILKFSAGLQSLTLSEVTIIKKLPAINPVNLRLLKSLTIYHCDWKIMKFISAQLNSLDVKTYFDEGTSKSSFINFLNQQRKLKQISLRGTSARTVFQHDDIVVKCQYNLQNFQLDHDFGKNSDAVNWNITSYLSFHSDTLKSVEIIGPNVQHIIGFIIVNLTNLEALSIDVRGLPKVPEFYEIVQRDTNVHLKKLSLSGFFVHPMEIQKILFKYPAVEELELNEWGNSNIVSQILEFVSRHFLNLKQLSISHISTSENIKFNSLVNLNVNNVRSSRKLVQFITHNISVSTLKVGLIYIGQVTESFIQELKNLKNIRHLAFGGNGKALKNIFELVKDTDQQTSLKSLELSLISDEKSTLNSRNVKKFYLPIEKWAKF